MKQLRRYPPGPRAKLPGGTFVTFRRDPIKFLMDAHREFGDLVHLKFGSVHAYLLFRPDHIRDVLTTHGGDFIKSRGLQVAKRVLGEGLLTSEGRFHQRQRRLVQPAFHRQRIAGYASVMVDYAARAADRWKDGETLDMREEMMRLTLAIVAKTLFNADVEGEAGEIGEALTAVIEYFNRLLFPFSEFMEKLPLERNRRYRQAKARLDATIYRIIAERRASGGDQGDLLSILLQALDAEGDGGGMTDRQVRDEAITLFLAGHETTANALTWTWYLLSEHPEVEAKLHAEIDEVLGGRQPTFEDIPRLTYTEKVLTESMRLFPPAWIIGRQALRDYPVGDYVAPAGSVLLMSQYVVHRDPKYFPDPGAFKPERWTPEAKAALPKYAYFPFGGGSRLCIGEGFAWVEGVLLLATIAQRWRMRLVPGHPVALQPLITLRPRHGMRMTLQSRKG